MIFHEKGWETLTDIGVEETILASVMNNQRRDYVPINLKKTALTGLTSKPPLTLYTNAIYLITSSVKTTLLIYSMTMCVMATHNVLTSLMRIKQSVQSAQEVMDIQD